MIETFKEFMENRRSDQSFQEDLIENAASIASETNIQPIIENTVSNADISTPPVVESKKLVYEEVQQPKIETIQGYKIYRDKPETFICDMEITGANPANSKARIIIESKDLTYMFEGDISDKGQCKIPLKKMNFLEENEVGKIKLEVIVEDMIFNPWVEDFVAVSSKKVSIKTIQESEESSNRVGIRISNIR